MLKRQMSGKYGSAVAALAVAIAMSLGARGRDATQAERRPHTTARVAPECDPDNAGLELPAGFCARVFADGLGHPRHLVVAANGDVFAALRGSRRDESPVGVVALRDEDGDGTADVVKHFGDRGGTGIALYGGYLYFGADDAILRYPLAPGRLEPSGPAETVVSGLPGTRSHRAKSIVITRDGTLFVNVGAPSNSCQEVDRQSGSPGQDPCPERERRAGIWKFDANRPGQTQADGERYATGLRNVVALALDPLGGGLYGVMHGRDQLSQNWPALFTTEQGAEKPSEEMVRIEEGDDFGWPYCYHDPELGRLVLAPEYGGDGKKAGRCAKKKEPIAFYPAHWAPLALLFYTGTSFPERYRGGAFIAFHGSWNRAPMPQGGYNVVFQPFDAERRPAGRWEVFADGFAGGHVDPRTAEHRPAGLAQGPDGSLYVSDDWGGTIFRIVYEGE